MPIYLQFYRHFIDHLEPGVTVTNHNFFIEKLVVFFQNINLAVIVPSYVQRILLSKKIKISVSNYNIRRTYLDDKFAVDLWLLSIILLDYLTRKKWCLHIPTSLIEALEFHKIYIVYSS